MCKCFGVILYFCIKQVQFLLKLSLILKAVCRKPTDTVSGSQFMWSIALFLIFFPFLIWWCMLAPKLTALPVALYFSLLRLTHFCLPHIWYFYPGCRNSFTFFGHHNFSMKYCDQSQLKELMSELRVVMNECTSSSSSAHSSSKLSRVYPTAHPVSAGIGSLRPSKG